MPARNCSRATGFEENESTPALRRNKEKDMNRSIPGCTLLLFAAVALGAQQAAPSGPYEGVSTPPPDSSIQTQKPQAAEPAAPPAANVESAPAQPVAEAPAQTPASTPDPDSQIVAVQPGTPTLTRRTALPDPDGDIVHPRPLLPGELPTGATIRVELLDQLSTVSSEKGEAFRSRVASDVLQDGQVLIPAGAEIDGRIASVSSGHPGGRGTMRLRPETIILADGTRFQLHAQLSSTPGAKSKVGSEGTVLPASRFKRDTVEYGGVVGTGVVAGAVVGGPVGAAAGGLIGAGVVSAHLLVSHPQATLEPGTVLIFTLSEPLQTAPTAAAVAVN
jgi:hypothetical protein